MASILNVALVFLACYAVCGEGKKTPRSIMTIRAATRLKDVVFAVQSHPNSFHKRRAEQFKIHLMSQLGESDEEEWPEVAIIDEKWFKYYLAYWAFLPILPRFYERYGNKSWVFLCEEETRVDVLKLLEIIKMHDPTLTHFLGRGLSEPESTFADSSKLFPSPDIRAGVLFSMPLIARLKRMLKYWQSSDVIFKNVNFEVAKLVWNGGKGLVLTNVPQFCVVPEEGCVTYLADKFVDCGPPIPEEDLFVAVKTSSKFHSSRVPTVKKTWGNQTSFIEYFSDVVDPSIPTVDLGIPSAKKGRCPMTSAILYRASKKGPQRRRWLLLANDETVINLQRLRQLLACYESSKVVVLGQRLGHKMHHPYGYSYLAAGAGMVFSTAAVRELREMDCESEVLPDDTAIGKYLERRMKSVIHSPYFHQGGLEDYSEDFLAGQLHISFTGSKNKERLKAFAFLMGTSRNQTQKDEL